MIDPSRRTVTAVLTYHDEDLGRTAPFPVASPWWADVEPVVEHLRTLLAVPVAVLRLVSVDDLPAGTAVPPCGGHVTYHVEALHRPASLPPLAPAPDAAALRKPAPFRMEWATSAGLRTALAWAAEHLDRAGPGNGADPDGAPAPGSGDIAARTDQVKTWNLSGLFRIRDTPDTTGGVTAWLKITPPFAAHEPSVIAQVGAVDAELVPLVYASDPAHRRTLMAHVPGTDCWDASPELIAATVTRWVAAQAAMAPRLHDADDVPDRRLDGLLDGVGRLLRGPAGARLAADEMAAARALERRLPAMIEELNACGLPSTLVHGDFHPGNWRSDGKRTVLVDFADAYRGHPAFDGERLRAFVGPERAPAVARSWCAAWAEHAPGSDPGRALDLARAMQALAGAVTYQTFLDHIEESERPYHEFDPVTGLREAIAVSPGSGRG